jgi:hypothetical protein
VNTKALNSLAELICRAQEQDRTPMGIAFAIDSAGRHMSPETAAELERLRDFEATVAGFVAARAEYVTALRNCHPDNGHDYDRWQGHAAARRQLAELLGLPVAWPPEDAAGSVAKSADRLTRMLAPTQAYREDQAVEGEHYASVHHSYRLSHDMPETDGAK